MTDTSTKLVDLAAALLRDVPRFDAFEGEFKRSEQGSWLSRAEVLTALSRALDPAIAERAGEVLPRLRKADEYEPLGHDGWEAADLITALLTANAALRAERDEHRRNWERAFNANTVLEERLTAAEAKVEKLTGALREIEWSNNSKWQADRARAALSATPTTEEGHE